MKDEIREAVAFLKQFIAKYGQLDQSQIDIIANMLTVALQERFVNHWYEDMPMKGQAFRCLRLKRSENYIDPDLEKILNQTGLKLQQLGLPNDFTLWIDPGEVSVRFGEQNGLGFTIARLNRDQNQTSPIGNPYERSSPKNHSPESRLGSRKPDGAIKTGMKPSDAPRSSLIVENTEKMFDEKLTAFIRQNSTSTNVKSDEKCSVLINDSNDLVPSATDSLLELQSSLSAEKRTISPPLSSALLSNSMIKRPNSSNISINKSNENVFKSEASPSKVIGSGIKVASSSLNTSNRLSYNDSCYYSSSSSSCASSYESNRSEHILPAAWNKPANLSSSFNDKFLTDTSMLNHFNSELNQKQSPQMLVPNMLKNNMNQGSKLTNLAFKNNQLGQNNNNLEGFGKGLYGLDLEDNPFSHLSAPYSNTLFSDASSDRSDTPSSCITNASTASYLIGPSSSPSLASMSAAYYDMRRAEGSMNQQNLFSVANSAVGSKPVLGTNNNMSNFESSSSSAASTMTVSNQLDENNNELLKDDFKENEENKFQSNEDELKNLGVEKELLAITGEESKKTGDGKKAKKTGKKKKEKSTEVKKEKKEKPTLATSPSSTGLSEKKQASSAEKKDDSYCGYVESFPYYYKLNRLYNALAVQKMQTERMKKSTSNLAGSPTTSASPVPFPPGIRHPSAALKNGATGTSPAQYQNNRFMMVSPSPSPNPMGIATSPKQGTPIMMNSKNGQAGSPASNLNSFMSTQGQTSNFNLMNANSFSSSSMFSNPAAASTSSQLIGNSKAPVGGQAYPMTPANAALSFANHQNRHTNNNSNHQRNNSNGIQNALNSNSLSLAQQLLSNQFSNLSTNSNSLSMNNSNNNTFGLNIESLFAGNSNGLSNTNSSSSLGSLSGLETNNNNFFPFVSQQSQQQMMNMFGQMNWMRGQSDMLKTNN